jgi:opacity protein-like surface antigen
VTGWSRLQPRALALAVFVTVLSPAAASAEWFIAPFIGAKFAGSTSILLDLEQGASNTRMTLGAAVVVLSDEVFGVEGEFGYSPRFFERSTGSNLTARSNVTTLMGNVLIAVPKVITRDALRPYAVAGLGLVHVGIKDLISVSPVDGNLLGMSVGGGAIGRLTNRTSLRFDLRHIRSIGRSGGRLPSLGETRISYWRLTAGVAFSGRLF